MEQRGIGRSGTYEHIMPLLRDKGYLVCKNETLVLTAHARSLCTFLSHHFPELFVPEFTARLEQQVDQVAAGELSRLDVLHDFWRMFSRTYKPLAAVFLPRNAPSFHAVTLGVCPKCGGKLVARYSPNGGQFAGCEHFPRCKGKAEPVLLSTAKAGR